MNASEIVLSNLENKLLRFFDIIFAGIGLICTAPVTVFIFLLLLLESNSPIFVQKRVGQHKRPFKILKFRTMVEHAPDVATHLTTENSITMLGKGLRRTKLDELPQLWNVLIGDMSFVGPRPCLQNQTELIGRREALGVFSARPGITGLAQISGTDMSTPKALAQKDSLMLQDLNTKAYFYYFFTTLLVVFMSRKDSE